MQSPIINISVSRNKVIISDNTYKLFVEFERNTNINENTKLDDIVTLIKNQKVRAISIYKCEDDKYCDEDHFCIGTELNSRYYIEIVTSYFTRIIVPTSNGVWHFSDGLIEVINSKISIRDYMKATIDELQKLKPNGCRAELICDECF